ncbi:MAG: cytochrome c biogenesis protein ResB [Nocardioides marinisabuli]|uniref:cytochrome c biogenesis protein ResB n=1 Tax=Nocardioides marinisabuli TaxID=419476 RepID=UPI00321A5C4E
MNDDVPTHAAVRDLSPPHQPAVTSSPMGWGRWAWRRLTAMRTAVILLILLALSAVPGSLLPQRGVASDPSAVAFFYREHPDLAPWLDRLSLFDVYSAPWFAAIYILLLVSMVGCVLPRCASLWQEFRTDPPAGPRRLAREAGHQRLRVADADAAMEAAARHLDRRGFRVVRSHGEVRAEKGHIREVGNLLFHLSLLILLVGVAGGRLFGYEGRVAVVEGANFANVSSSYDAITPAPLADLADLEPMQLTLESFEAEFETTGSRRGEPRDFAGAVSYRSDAEGSGTFTVRPNRPLDINGTKFFLTGHGYAPEVTVRDGNGDVAMSGPTIFLPMDQAFTSDGVVKVPDARPDSIALQGLLLPTAAQGEDGISVSIFPDDLNPRLELTAYTGDLGLDDGAPQSVFALDFDDLEEVTDRAGGQWRVSLAPGQTARLPGGLGSVTFDGLSRFANFQVARDPGKEISLIAAIVLLLGLTVSLGVARRRVWVRAVDDLTVEIAARTLSRRAVPHAELMDLTQLLQTISSDDSRPLKEIRP